MKISNFQFYLSGVLIIVAYFAGLGVLPLLGPDEPRYAQVAREMYLRSDWITPTLGGFNWFEKPALLYWLEIAAYQIFGVNEFAARFGSAVCGLLTVATISLFSIYSFQSLVAQAEIADAKEKNPNPKIEFGFWALLISASSIGLLVFAHAASFDIILTFPVTAALCCFAAFDVFDSKSRIQNLKFLGGFYFFVGVALLAKGLVGIVLPFGIVFFYFAAMRKFPNKTFALSLLWGSLLGFLVAAVWYLPTYLRHGWTFIDEFFIQHHFARYTSNKYAHPEPFYYFWLVLPALALPWLPFFLIALWKFFRARSFKSQIFRADNLFIFGTKAFKLRMFVFCWLLMPLLFFSFSGSKLPGYILPALPAAIILAIQEIWHLTRNNKTRALAVKAVAFTVLLIVPISLYTFAQSFARDDTAKFLLEAADAQNDQIEKVLNLHDISHSLEFYAAGRLVRTADGKQRKFEGVGEIADYLQQEKQKKALVLVPREYAFQLEENTLLSVEKIADNNFFVLFAVSLK